MYIMQSGDWISTSVDCPDILVDNYNAIPPNRYVGADTIVYVSGEGVGRLLFYRQLALCMDRPISHPVE
jgi:hypothetical protein